MKLATLLYIKNSKGEYLLLNRANHPNKGFLSPPGGKLKTDIAESPVSCAVRESREECGIISVAKDWKLRGIISEKNYPNIGNILIFAFEYLKPIENLPPNFSEGQFIFLHPDNFNNSNIPDTDKLYLWNFVINYTENLFSLYLDCSDNQIICTVEQE